MFLKALENTFNVDSNVDNLLQDYYAYMLNACKKLNLVSRRDVNTTLRLLIEDSLAVLQWKDCHLTSPILDIGTGGGFPGVPLILVIPELTIHLLDSNRRKCSFLEITRQKYGIDGLHIINSRVDEVIGSGDYQQHFSTIVSRATATTSTILGWSKELIKPGGELILWKGSSFQNEYSASDLDGWSGPDYFDLGKALRLVKFGRLSA